MNLPAVAQAPSRPQGHSEMPDILYVLRRYTWLIVTGVVLGTAVGGGLFTYFRKSAPRYTATVQFQVLPPPARLAENNAPIQNSSEETTQFINRQVLYLKTNESLLNEILQNNAFRYWNGDPSTNRPSAWWDEHGRQPKIDLLKDMAVEPVASAAVFRVSMTTKNSEEAARLVNTIADSYLTAIREENAKQTSNRLNDLEKVRDKQEESVRDAKDALTRFRELNNITGVLAAQAVELEELRELNGEYITAEAQANGALAIWTGFQKQMGPDKKNTDDVALTPEYVDAVEHDGMNQTLESIRLSYERDLVGEQVRTNSSPLNQKVIEAQIAKTDSQKDLNRAKVEKEARAKMLGDAETRSEILAAQADFIKGLRDSKELHVRELDQSLILYQSKQDDLKTQQDILDKVTVQYRLTQLQLTTDDMRIQTLGGNALVPDDISWPVWYTFIPFGAVGGLALSFILSYLLILTDTRVRTPRDITRVLQLPMLGFVPDENDDSALKGEIATAIRTSPASMTAESFRQIRNHISSQTNGNPVSTLLVASIAPGGGATTVASNVAAGMALNGLRVLLIDANFYRPGLANVYKDIPEIGLRDAILNPASLESAIVPCAELPKLHLMGAGNPVSPTASEILETKSFPELLEKLKARYEVIIFDGAPLNLVSDSISLAGRVDGVIAVIRAGEVSRGTVNRVRDQLRQVRANLLGFVLNAAQTNSAGYFKENYRTFYRYAGYGNRRTESVAARL